ncbi:pilus assembly protein [Collimonas fungivorans]|nr:PilC/PilY family type IV pilus protein [Collimonas fungivorans]
MKTIFACICTFMLTIGWAANGWAANGRAANTPDEPPFIYTASYEAASWQGHVKAYPIGETGVSGTAQWDAADLIPAWQLRQILTAADEDAVIPFEWQHLDDRQKAALSSEDVLQYLRGDDALEIRHGGRFRDRKGKLGDIINSVPLYVGLSDSAYQWLPATAGGDSYQRFVDSKKQRRAMLYVGANDGMLHGFDAIDGVEKSAFIPRAVFDSLPVLSEAGYVHRLFVDGLLTAGDAYLGKGENAAWKTILLGSTGVAAKSLFALDASDPDASLGMPLLWQRGAEDDGQGAPDDDMGYQLGEAFAIRLRNGDWGAIYGNGYQSAKQGAVLYLVELAGGELIRKLVAGAAASQTPNGLSTPALVFSKQREVNAAYAGDLLGNLWKFDLGATEPQRWQAAFDGRPLFAAADDIGKSQSLILQPLLEHHPKGGALVMFGAGDKPQTASLYGIWEKTGAGPVADRNQLQRQTLAEVETGKWQLSGNAVNWNRQRGWYTDLPEKVGQVVGKLQIIDGVLWVLTYSAAEGKSYLIAIEYSTGGATPEAALADFPKTVSMIEVAPSTVTPAAITLPDGRRQLVIKGRDGTPHAIRLNTPERRLLRTWRQLPVPLTPE